MPQTRPEKYPLVATFPLSNYAEPPSGVALNGWNVGAIFPSSDANWLGDHWSKWNKYLSEQVIAGPDALNLAVAQRVSSIGLAFDLLSGLSPLSPTDTGVYMVFGCRVDLTGAETKYTGAAAFTFTPNTTNYVHIRPQPDLSGPLPASSTGEILVSTNAVEAGYLPILSYVADATDLISSTELATYGYLWTRPITFTDLGAIDLTVTDLLTFGRAQGLSVAGSHTLTLSPPVAHRALYVTGSTSAELVRLEQAGSGEGLYVSSSSTVALRAVGSDTAGIYAVRVDAGTNGHGIDLRQGSTNSVGLAVTGGTSQQRGVDVTGGTGSSNAEAIRGTAGHADANGVHGRTSSSASTTAAGVYGEGQGAGTIGVLARSDAGPALIVRGDTTSPVYPELVFTGQNADPTDTTGGNVYRSTTQKQIRHCVAGSGYKSLAQYGPGSACHAISTQAHNSSVNYGGVYGTLLSASCDDTVGNGFYGVSAGAKVKIMFAFDVRTGVAATDDCHVILQDMTNGGATIAEWTGSGTGDAAAFFLPVATTSWQRSIAGSVTYAPPNEGTLTVRMQVKRTTNNGFARSAKLEVQGTFP